MAIWDKQCQQDGYEHYCCSDCGKPAIFESTYDIDCDYTEYQTGIGQYLTPYCPNCGAKMNISEIIYRDWKDDAIEVCSI